MAEMFVESSYDVVPYPSFPFPQSHPDRLATLATLFGMRPPPVKRCRVLELGCASGGNLIPMAVELQESTFVGIDLSIRQLAEGQAAIEALGLQNIQLMHMNILDVPADCGQFDYIIAHGVYSWVPPAVQDQILAICKQHLSPNGVGDVSYNTYPGWHFRGMIRDMMRYHAGQFPELRMRMEHARALLAFLAKSVPADHDVYGMLLKRELEWVSRTPDPYLFHGRAELLEILADLVANGALGQQEVAEALVDKPAADGSPAHTILAEALDRSLSHLARAALLVG